VIPVELRRMIRRGLRSAEMARVFALVAFGTAFSSFAIQRLSGPWTLRAMVAGLCILGLAILVARRRELSLLHLAPTMLMAFVLWALASAFWADEGGDTLQTVRALGDVLRALLAASLAAEILSGILIDMPIPVLQIAGNIAMGGPVQGLFGTRNYLGFVAVVALVTFLVEWRTQSISPGRSVFSIALAGLLAVLSASPTAFVVAVVATVAVSALALVRRVDAARRQDVQLGLGVVVAVGALAAYLLRARIVDIVGAATDFSNRSRVWLELFEWIRRRWITGWGWHGGWSDDVFPFNSINWQLRDQHASALNAYLDVALQLGWVGVILFAGMCAVALVRSWVTASERRSSVYAWTPLVLVAILSESMFESFALDGAGWMLLALCLVRAGQARSWRTRIGETAHPPTNPLELPHEPHR
jgi:O-antigen ligase